jgi:hypothetical protein
MAFDFDEFNARIDARIDDALAAGVHPETRNASTFDCVDNNGHYRQAIEPFNYHLTHADVAPIPPHLAGTSHLRPLATPPASQRIQRVPDHLRRTGRTTRLLQTLLATPGSGPLAFIFPTTRLARHHYTTFRSENSHPHWQRLNFISTDTLEEDQRGRTFRGYQFDHTCEEQLLPTRMHSARVFMAERTAHPAIFNPQTNTVLINGVTSTLSANAADDFRTFYFNRRSEFHHDTDPMHWQVKPVTPC